MRVCFVQWIQFINQRNFSTIEVIIFFPSQFEFNGHSRFPPVRHNKSSNFVLKCRRTVNARRRSHVHLSMLLLLLFKYNIYRTEHIVFFVAPVPTRTTYKIARYIHRTYVGKCSPFSFSYSYTSCCGWRAMCTKYKTYTHHVNVNV